MQDIYVRLRSLGFSRPFLRDCILPDWWEDSMASVPANRALIETILSRQLGLDMAGLSDPTKELTLKPELVARFKTRQGVTADRLNVAQTLVSRVATIAAACSSAPPPLENLSAIGIRQDILASGAPWIGLDHLLDFCWKIGIPVVHLCRKPTGGRWMDGAAVRCEGRPVIVIACQYKQPARQLFILAHELGHIVCGHLSSKDDNIWDEHVQSDVQEKQEREANDFAVELLAGNRNTKLAPRFSWLTAADLADSARSLGKELAIDPGVIALNYAWNQGFMQVGTAALNLLVPEADAASQFRAHYPLLDLDSLPEDSRRVFECLTASE